jgi:hypothetical protein
MIQIPIYECLAAANHRGFYIGLRRKSFWSYYPQTADGQETSANCPFPPFFILLVDYFPDRPILTPAKNAWLTFILFSLCSCARGWVCAK